MVEPVTGGREPAPPEVPEALAKDYNEACTILSLSPKATAALARRCLQAVIRTAAGITKRTLNDEIDELIKRPDVPQALKDTVDIVRHQGNWAAHPEQYVNSNEIIDVEANEAEFTLDVVELLFRHFYVEPAQIQKKRAEMQAKLAKAGKTVPLK